MHHITAMQLMNDGLIILAACKCGALIRGRSIQGIETEWANHLGEVTP